jgi:hypothetical protein
MTRSSKNPPLRPQQNGAVEAADGSDGASLVSTLLQFSGWSVYAGALLTITGWAYADRYFALFGLGLSAIDSDMYGAFYIYAFWALSDSWIFVLAALMYVVGALVVVWLWDSSAKFWRPAAALIIAVAMPLSIAGAFNLGQWRADEQVPRLISENYATYPRVLVHVKEGSAADASLKSKKADSSCLRKLFMDKRNLYLYPGYEKLRNTIPPVYVVPLSEVVFVEVIRNPGLCQE